MNSYSTAVKHGVAEKVPIARDKRKAVNMAIPRPHCLQMKFERNHPDVLEKGLRATAKNIVLKGVTTKQIVSIAVRPYHTVDVTCRTRAEILTLDKYLKQQNIAGFKWFLYVEENTTVNISWIPGHIKKQQLRSTLLEFVKELDSDIQEAKDEDGILNGWMYVSVPTNQIQQHPIPSFIYVEGCMISVKYRGQQQTCMKCNEVGHFKFECPKQNRFINPLKKQDRFTDKQTLIRINDKTQSEGLTTDYNDENAVKRDHHNNADNSTPSVFTLADFMPTTDEPNSNDDKSAGSNDRDLETSNTPMEVNEQSGVKRCRSPDQKKHLANIRPRLDSVNDIDIPKCIVCEDQLEIMDDNAKEAICYNCEIRRYTRIFKKTRNFFVIEEEGI
ncbi:uncharacterized protein LOC144432058 [Styela clava]